MNGILTPCSLFNAEKNVIRAQAAEQIFKEKRAMGCCLINLVPAEKQVMQAESNLRIAEIRCCCDKQRILNCGCNGNMPPRLF